MLTSIGVVFLIATAYLILTEGAAKQKIYYFDAEHINLTYSNPKFVRNMNLSARRFGRKDPIHYVHVHFESQMPAGNNVLVDVYFFEFLGNEYRRSFVEVHYKFCDFMLRDKIFGPFFNKHLPKTCPLPKGAYHMVNISVPNLPLLSTFPFQKGRLFLNLSVTGPDGDRDRIAEIYTDLSIKQRWV